jgi:TRAP-type C4-dicarboxylate transport system permease small subunit
MANKILTYVDEHLENFLVFPMYFIMMALMAIGVIQRFVFKFAWRWGTYICIALFCWFSWLGCSRNVKERAHLRLSFLRSKLPRKIQFALLMLDYALWIAFAIIASYFSVIQIFKLASVGAMVYGTESIPKWIVPLCIPVSFTVLVFRVIQNIIVDVRDFRSNRPLKLNPTATVDQV